MYFKKIFKIFQLILKGEELSDGEHGVIADKEVLQRILDADFRNHGLDLVNPKSHIHFFHEYVKAPKDGLYLFKAFNPKDRSSIEVLIDTRIFPNFVSIEDNPHNPKATREVLQIIDYSLSLAVGQFKWESVLKRSRMDRVQYLDEFWSAMDYADNIIYQPNQLNLTLNQPQVSQLIMEYNNQQDKKDNIYDRRNED